MTPKVLPEALIEELLPCPFCGGPAHLDTVGKGGSRHAAVFCDDNQCPGVVHGVGAGIDNQKRSAIAAWNRRSPPSRVLQDEGVVAKALVWEQLTSPREDGPHEPIAEWEATCLAGIYCITEEGGEWWLSLATVMETIPNIGRSSDPDILRGIAQADYEARIRSAILPSTIGGSVGVSEEMVKAVTEEMVEKAKDEFRRWTLGCAGYPHNPKWFTCRTDDAGETEWIREFSDSTAAEDDLDNSRLRAALTAALSPAISGEPTGWVLVPREPTDEMVRAAMRTDLSYMPNHQGPDRAAVYRAMIAASPSIQAQER